MSYKLEGKKFGRLTAVEYVGSDINKRRIWKCSCECGNEVLVTASLLVGGKTKSCGCIRKEKMAETAKERGRNAISARNEWADRMVDDHHAKFYADGYVYIISDIGEVYGPSGKLAQCRDNKGYMRFKRKAVHRIVAQNFVPGFFEGAEVDHINFRRDDNRKENLRWVTPQENKLHSRENIIASNKRRSIRTQANQR